MSETKARAGSGELPYELVSVNAPGRAMEWMVPLWDAINALVEYQGPPKRQRTPKHASAVNDAVHIAMRIALESRALAGAAPSGEAPSAEYADAMAVLMVQKMDSSYKAGVEAGRAIASRPSEEGDQPFDSHACMTGDCDHASGAACTATLAAEYIRIAKRNGTPGITHPASASGSEG